MEVYTNFANIGYIKKEYQKDPHMAVYIELFKKHFKITYINNVVINKKYITYIVTKVVIYNMMEMILW